MTYWGLHTFAINVWTIFLTHSTLGQSIRPRWRKWDCRWQNIRKVWGPHKTTWMNRLLWRSYKPCGDTNCSCIYVYIYVELFDKLSQLVLMNFNEIPFIEFYYIRINKYLNFPVFLYSFNWERWIYKILTWC